jgi:Restriction endonuclease
MERIALTKKIRFEVFKRDKFTCNYCGRKAPDVVLQVDHIEPVAKGGENDIANLITSCYECNIGKSDRPLSDNAVVEKQRKQLEMLQERREQIELMFEWKKSLSKLDDKTLGMIKEYADAKINPYSINESGKAILGNLLRRYGANEVLEAIDVSATTYLKFLNDGKLDQTSAEIFLNKIGGILFNRRLKPIDQKLAFIKNKAKNSFNYYDSRRHAILLNRYIITLRRHWHYNDDAILKDLDSELLPKLEEMSNWTEWCELLESWIESIEKKSRSRSTRIS